MKVGDIIRFDHFVWTSDGDNQADPPIWGRLVTVDEDDVPEEIGPNGNFEYLAGGAPGWLPEGEGAGNDIAFYSPDRWEIVPEDEVPGEVWAAIAKRELEK